MRTRLQSRDPSQRPSLLWDDPSSSAVRSHPFFSSCPYLRAHSFLESLPVRAEEDRAAFFASLLPSLFSAAPAEVLAPQMSRPLLSRHVLLDREARRSLLPGLLTPAKCECTVGTVWFWFYYKPM